MAHFLDTAGTAAPRGRGFTLVEVLVALFIMALLAGMAWRGVDGIMRSRDASQARLDGQLRLQAAIGQWEADLAAVQDSRNVVQLMFDGAALRLTRRTDEGMQVIVWSLREGRWTRWAGPAVRSIGALQESWLNSQQLLGNEPGTVRLLEGVQTWRLYYWRNNAWTNAQSTGDSADSSGPPGGRELLPGGIRLLLEFGPGSGHSGTLTRDIVLPPQPAATRRNSP